MKVYNENYTVDKDKANRWGYEYKSKMSLMGLPLLHISFGFKSNGIPIPAVGVISIGQFGAGIINISQFGVGLISISQFSIAMYAIGQVTFAYSSISQVGIYIDQGYGQVVVKLADILGLF